MTTIEIRQRRDDVHAQIKGMPERWGCGADENEAIGDLVKTHPYSFGFSVQVIKNLKEMSNTLAGIYVVMDKKFYKIEIER